MIFSYDVLMYTFHNWCTCVVIDVYKHHFLWQRFYITWGPWRRVMSGLHVSDLLYTARENRMRHIKNQLSHKSRRALDDVHDIPHGSHDVLWRTSVKDTIRSSFDNYCYPWFYCKSLQVYKKDKIIHCKDKRWKKNTKRNKM